MNPRPGDVFLEHGTHFIDRLIQFGQRLRFPAADARWNHAGIVVDWDGGTLEAEGNGVIRRMLTADRDVRIIAVEGVERRNYVTEYAWRRAGRRYNFVEIVALVMRLCTGSKFSFGIDGEYICSGLVASCMEYAGLDVADSPEDCYPADLARWADAHPAPAAVPAPAPRPGPPTSSV